MSRQNKSQRVPGGNRGMSARVSRTALEG